ncbi:MAG: hypothetical protein ABI992_02635, partial [Chthoniobacterales bacterium]
EIGETTGDDLFLRLEYDGAIALNGGETGKTARHFAALGGTRAATEAMESFLLERHDSAVTLARALSTAMDAWTVGHLASADEATNALPSKDNVAAARRKSLQERGVEAALLERSGKIAIRYRPLTEKELQPSKAG